MLVISQEEIKREINLHHFIDAVEQAVLIYESGKYDMPLRMEVDFGKKNTLLLMPCGTESFFGTKLISLFPNNPALNLPVTTGLVVLNNGETGVPLALMDGAVITGLRTSAIGSLSIKYMTDESVTKLGMIGAGVQGYYQTLMACSVRKFTDVYLSDVFPQKLEELRVKLQKDLPNVKIHKLNSPDEVLRASEVIITATNTTVPLFSNDESLFNGKHFVAIGSYKPEMREYPQAIFSLLDYVFIDTEHALHETGDLITPLNEKWIKEEQVLSFGKIIKGEFEMPKNTNPTLFKTVGMALFDVVTANMIYQIAREKGFGLEVSL